MEPLVSIIVPVYNTELYLGETIESIMAQTYKNIEIICVDDGSTDHSLDRLCEFQHIDERIRVFSKPNGGGKFC